MSQTTYTEQRYCPVTGERLGAHGPAIPVEIVEQLPPKPPTLWQKCFGWARRAEPPEQFVWTVYVCCPECVAAVKAAPHRYILKVHAERCGAPSSGSSAACCGR